MTSKEWAAQWMNNARVTLIAGNGLLSDEVKDSVAQVIEKAIAQECEFCAQTAEEHPATTPSEIASKIRERNRAWGGLKLRDESETRRLPEPILKAKVEAYEEAAQAAELQLGVPADAYAEDEHKLIAQYIRSLKHSLVAHSVP